MPVTSPSARALARSFLSQSRQRCTSSKAGANASGGAQLTEAMEAMAVGGTSQGILSKTTLWGVSARRTGHKTDQMHQRNMEYDL